MLKNSLIAIVMVAWAAAHAAAAEPQSGTREFRASSK